MTDETSDTSLILHPFKEIFLSENFLSTSEMILNFMGMCWGGIFSHLTAYENITFSSGKFSFIILFISSLFSLLFISGTPASLISELSDLSYLVFHILVILSVFA